MPLQVFKPLFRSQSYTTEQTPLTTVYQIEANHTYVVQAPDLIAALTAVQSQLEDGETVVEVKELYQATLIVVTPEPPKTKRLAKKKKKKNGQRRKLSAEARRHISEGRRRMLAERRAVPPVAEPFREE